MRLYSDGASVDPAELADEMRLEWVRRQLYEMAGIRWAPDPEAPGGYGEFQAGWEVCLEEVATRIGGHELGDEIVRLLACNLEPA